MSKYYYLVAGLPNIAFDGGKPPYTVLWFKDELSNHLTKADQRLLDLLFLKVDNKNLLEQLQYPDYEPETEGKITVEEMNVLITGLQKVIDDKKERDRIIEERNKMIEEFAHESELPPLPPVTRPFRNKNKRLPAYFVTFARTYLESVANEEAMTIPWEDRLSAIYYEYAMKSSNPFIASWFELNLNINNIFTALTCRKYKLDRANYIVGDTELSDKLRTSDERDFELGESMAYWLSVIRIAESADLLQRELKIDLLKWEWLDEQIFMRIFDIESVLVYILKLEILERWTGLDKTTGDQTFRQLVGTMKKGSENTLEEFKRNNKK